MPNNFCRYLSNQVRVEYGFMKPCCWFKKSIAIDDVEKVQQFRQKLASIQNWDDTDGNCAECWQREQLGAYSPRLQSLSSPDFAEVVSDDAIVKLEIQIDRDCNAACLICGPWNSSTWEKYNARTLTKFDATIVPEIQDTDQQTLQQIAKLKKIFPLDHSTDVRFLGGEPLRNRHHINLLEDVAHPESMTLNYTTNGSYRPSAELMKFWKRFKRVNLQFSIDGIGEQFNYLRWPLQWHQVESNMRFIIEQGQENIRIIRGSYTTTPLSLFYHDRYVEAYEQFQRSVNQPVMPWFDQPWQPRGITPMELSAVPPGLAQVIRDKYGPDHAITKLLVEFDPNKHAEFKEYINRNDYLRNLNWRETFPEMIEYFD